jgi:hypothetical protein
LTLTGLLMEGTERSDMMRITNNPNRNLECTRPVPFFIFLDGALRQNDLFHSSCRSHALD